MNSSDRRAKRRKELVVALDALRERDPDKLAEIVSAAAERADLTSEAVDCDDRLCRVR